MMRDGGRGLEPATIAAMDDQWRVVRRHGDWSAAIRGMDTTRTRLRITGLWSAGPSALLDVLGVTGNEVLNCRVVRWLLDPMARHGIGADLTSQLFERCKVTLGDPALVSVVVEESREHTRADIVVRSPEARTCVVIEAKLYAGEGVRQAARLEEHWPEADRFVFLTIGGHDTPETARDPGRWEPLSWNWFAEAASGPLAHDDGTNDFRRAKARRAALDWIDMTRRRDNRGGM
jgi:hypothetical protein